MIKAHVIALENDERSSIAADRLVESSNRVSNEFTIDRFKAVVPDDVQGIMSRANINWNYPWEGSHNCWASGLIKTAYETAKPARRMACFLSHYSLWCESVGKGEPILVFEHDALFQQHLDVDLLLESRYGIIGLNDPRGATRRSLQYHELMQANPDSIQPVPKIDDLKIPQGLAGNSAYLIKPAAAMKLINLVDEFGAWPNDAIMCQQLMPGMLGVTKTYYTIVQKIQSTTTL